MLDLILYIFLYNSSLLFFSFISLIVEFLSAYQALIYRAYIYTALKSISVLVLNNICVLYSEVKKAGVRLIQTLIEAVPCPYAGPLLNLPLISTMGESEYLSFFFWSTPLISPTPARSLYEQQLPDLFFFISHCQTPSHFGNDWALMKCVTSETDAADKAATERLM